MHLAHRLQVPKDKIAQDIQNSPSGQLIAMSDTRSFPMDRKSQIHCKRFAETYVPIMQVHEVLQNYSEQETAKIAYRLLSVVQHGSFVSALIIAEKFFSYILKQ
jgi:hypothetical protein